MNPQEILAWLNLSQAVAQDKGIIGSVASRIQKSMRETELSEKRRQARMDMNAETRKRREEIAEAVPPDVQAEMALMPVASSRAEATGADPAYAAAVAAHSAVAMDDTLMQEDWGRKMEETRPSNGDQYDRAAPAPAAAPVEAAAAVPQAAGVAPGVQMPAGLQDWRQIKPGDPVTFPPRADIAGAPEFPEAPEAPEVTTRPDWPPRVFTFMELMAQAREARTGEEFGRVTAQLPEVIEVDPAMGGGSLAEIISGVSRRDQGTLRRDLMSAHVKGRKEKKEKDVALAHLRGMRAWEIKQKTPTWQAAQEARAARDRAAAAAKDAGRMTKGDRTKVHKWGQFLDDNQHTDIPEAWRGKPETEIMGLIISESKSSPKGTKNLQVALNDVFRKRQESGLSVGERQQLAALRGQIGETRKSIDLLENQYQTIRTVTDWNNLKQVRASRLERLKAQQAAYVAEWGRLGRADEAANMVAGFEKEMGLIAPMPPKPGKETPASAPRRD